MLRYQDICDYINSIGLVTITNDMCEKAEVFPNGYRASVIENREGFSIACMDYNGYICYHVPEKNDTYICVSDEKALDLIKRISEIPSCLPTNITYVR